MDAVIVTRLQKNLHIAADSVVRTGVRGHETDVVWWISQSTAPGGIKMVQSTLGSQLCLVAAECSWQLEQLLTS